TYDLWINGVQVTDANKDDLTVIDGVSGTRVIYSPTVKTLVLNNATISTSSESNIVSNIDQLTIRVNGTNKLKVTSSSGYASMIINAHTYIVGTDGAGSLECSGYNNSQDACRVNDATLSIQSGANVSFTGFYGIRGNGFQKAILSMSGEDTKLTAGGKYPIGGVKSVLSDGLTITEPAGAYFDENDGYIMKGSDGYMLHDVDVVISKPETAYDLWINATQVTSENAGNLSVIDGVTGTVTYNATNKTLLLNNATLTSETTNIMSKIDGLTINVVGTNSLSATSGAGSNISVKKPMTITGTGTLNASATGSDGSGCYVDDQATLTIQGGVEAHFTGKYGIFGYGSTAAPKLIVSGTDTWVTANGTTYCIFHMPATLNDGLAITQPAGATFNSVGNVVDASGSTISRQDVVISMPVSRGFKYMGLWYEEISGTSGVTLIAPQGVTTYSGNVVIPPAFNYMGTVYEVRAIEANAFTGTAVTSVEVPSTVKTIGDGAFYGATSLSTLIFATEDMPNKLTLGEEFVGNNASDFKFYVCNACLPAWTVRYDYNFLPWVITKDNGFLSFASSQGVTLPEGLTAYRVTGYNSGSRMATTTRLSSSAIPERTGLVLKGQPATRYLLQAASSAPAVGDNMLLPLIGIEDIPYAPFAANPDDSKIYFLGGSCERWNVFVNSVDLFGKLNLGQAYLAVDKSLL
ncbi:MAG: leucine-rich repeat protein, partial [Muribaculaceae bacterium]|nr:leucine-rich repeat protein [Muribaculaceae bacterium]